MEIIQFLGGGEGMELPAISLHSLPWLLEEGLGRKGCQPLSPPRGQSPFHSLG